MRTRVLKWLLIAGLVLTGLAVGGLLVSASGIIPIKASSGHWALTRWLLQFSKRRSVGTHSLLVEKPPLEKPWLVLKGAGHYETGCSFCHGSPALETPGVVGGMTPAPPRLAARIATWDREELFYIVKHGIKFTGMPAWPSQRRDDEVQAMVAFLLALPELDAQGYRQLVHGEVPAAGAVGLLPDSLDRSQVRRTVTESCARCHGLDGLGRGNAAFPKLAGQSHEYLKAALEAYAGGKRHSGVMQPIAVTLKASEKHAVARFYSRLSADASSDPLSSDPSIARGERIASRGIFEQGVPSCSDCHGPGGAPRNAAYPNLAGQYADYLVLQLELFKTQNRGGSPYAHLMNHVATRLNPEQMRDVARYYASLASTGEKSSQR